MKRYLKFLAIPAGTVAAVGVGAVAWAYWSAGGTGASSATTATLNAPTAVDADASNHMVTVTWTASSTGGNAVAPLGYKVDRYTSVGVFDAVACAAVPSGGLLECKETVAALGSYKYRVTALLNTWTAASDLTDAVSVTAGPAVKLAFGTSPAGASGGTAFTTQPVVLVQDAFDYTVTTDSTSSVSLAIGSNPAGGTLSGTNTATAAAGVATFSGLSIDKAGTGYTLAASSSGLTSATSAPFDVTVGPGARLAFGQQPTNAVSQVAISPAVTVRVLDAGGNLTTSSTSVTMAIGANPAAGTLSGTATVDAVSGTATFSTLSIDKAGTGYTLTAAASGLAGATSSTFDITAGAANKLAFAQQPTNSTAGQAITPAVTVRVLDAAGNLTTSSAGVTVAIGTNPGAGTLSGTTSVNAVSGTATFSTLSIDKAATGYTLTAAGSGLTGATSGTFNITAAAASKLAFGTPPGGATGGTAFTTQPMVLVQDAFGNTVTTDNTSSVSLAIGSNPASGTLSGTATVTAANGVATFSGLSIDKAGNGYTLTASRSGLTSATSAPFDVTVGPAARLVFGQQPTNAVSQVAISPAVTVRVLDAGGNTVTGSSATVTLAIGTNPSAGVLSGCVSNPLNASSGVASFSGCKIDKAGTGYTLTATSGSLTSATSSPFNITVGSAFKLAFTTSPSNAAGGGAFPTQPVVEVQDAGGNRVTGSSAPVTLAIGTNPSAGVLSGCASNPLNASSGVATFSGCNIDKAGTGYTLRATSGSLTLATSNAFNITAGPTITTPSTASPQNVAQGATATVVLTGTGFQTGATVTIAGNGYGLNTAVIDSSTQITLTITTPNGNKKSASITVTNPDGGAFTCTNCVTT